MTSKSVGRIRNYRAGDFNDYLRLRREAEAMDRSANLITAERLTEDLGRPGRPPEKTLLLAELEDRLIGAIWLTPEAEIDRLVVQILVHPDHRRTGWGGRLLNRAMEEAGYLGLNTIQADVDRTDEISRRFWESHGFEQVRRFLEMSLDLTAYPENRAGEIEPVCGCLDPADAETLARLQNAAFKGSWGFNPNTPEEIAWTIAWRGGEMTDVVVAFDRDRPCGYCWLKIDREQNRVVGRNRGRIHMLGVDPGNRRRGTGLTVLTSGLNRLKSMGLTKAVLTVDQDNAAALGLYRQVGFKTNAVTDWYELIL